MLLLRARTNNGNSIESDNNNFEPDCKRLAVAATKNDDDDYAIGSGVVKTNSNVLESIAGAKSTTTTTTTFNFSPIVESSGLKSMVVVGTQDAIELTQPVSSGYLTSSSVTPTTMPLNYNRHQEQEPFQYYQHHQQQQQQLSSGYDCPERNDIEPTSRQQHMLVGGAHQQISYPVVYYSNNSNNLDHNDAIQNSSMHLQHQHQQHSSQQVSNLSSTTTTTTSIEGGDGGLLSRDFNSCYYK